MVLENLSEIRDSIRYHLNRHVLLGSFQPQVEAAKYVVLNESASLWRPLLTISTARDYNVDLERAIPLSSVIELVHAASLIEDDIADEAPLRRGKNSCHVQFGNDLAHLAQMYLVQKAYDIMLNSDLGLGDKQRIAITSLASKSGLDMIWGQTKDVKQIELKTSKQVLRMYGEKSGALIGLALACGGILGDATEEDVNTLRKLGIAMGVSYQISDDVLDSFACPTETGKPGRQDEQKRTLLKLVGLDGARDLKSAKDADVEDLLNSLSIDSKSLREVADHLRQRHNKYF